MKKWPIIVITLVLLVAYIGFLAFWFTREGPADTTVPVETTAASTSTQPVQTQPQTQPTVTVPPTTLPPETIPVETTEHVRIDPPKSSATTAKYAFVYDCGAQELLYSKGDQNDRVKPASLTKLYTAYIVLLHMDPDDVVTVGQEISWIDPHSSLADLKTGNRLTVAMLVQGLLMESGNDAAYTLAVATGRTIAGNQSLSAKKALSVFVQEMNNKAEELGLNGSHFANPDGIDASGHYMTMKDLMKVSALALAHPTIRSSTSISRDKVTFVSGQSYNWHNTNALIDPESEYYCEDAFGLKTGYTDGAGNCLISAFHTGDNVIVIGVVGCPGEFDRFSDSLVLYKHYQ